MVNFKVYKRLTFSFLTAGFACWTMQDSSPAFTLSSGTGDGAVTVGVDGYGSFGFAIGPTASDALFDPVGPTEVAGTTYESGVAIRFGNTGQRRFLSTGLNSNLPDPAVRGRSTKTRATSSFDFDGLLFSLVQTLSPLKADSQQTGVVLTQTYRITNPTDRPLEFELVRYFDGDLLYDISYSDGGGRSVVNGQERLFQTDSAEDPANPTTFVSVTATGGTVPATNRYEIDSFQSGSVGLRSRIITGFNLDDTITNDKDGDQFIDPDLTYDVALALRNVFRLTSGQSATYTTTTTFASGTPTAAVPEPGTIAGLTIAGAGLTYLKRRQKRT